jgi:hypothetical protein
MGKATESEYGFVMGEPQLRLIDEDRWEEMAHGKTPLGLLRDGQITPKEFNRALADDDPVFPASIGGSDGPTYCGGRRLNNVSPADGEMHRWT